MDTVLFLLHIRGLKPLHYIINLFSRGGKFRGRKISRNSIRSGYYFRGRKISRKIKIREYSENFLHAKNWCYTVPEFEINNTAIDRVSMYKYLGHCINDELSDDDDMTRQRNKIYAQGNALIRKFYMCTENVKIALFKSYCTTLYTSTLWCKYRRESLRKLCVAYNNIFRKLTHQARDCSASQMFVSRQLPTCKMLIRRNVYGFMLNVQKSNNLILNSIVHLLNNTTLCANWSLPWGVLRS